MSQYNSTDNPNVIEEQNDVNLVNSNNSEQLNPHYYANENLNQHGAYDPNFNAGLSSYQPNPINQPIQHDEFGKAIPLQTQVNNHLLETQTEIDSKLKKKKIKKIIGVTLIVLVLIALAIFVFKIIFKKEPMTFEKLGQTEAFFLMDDEGYYALFNEDGKQLTEFEFETTGDFYGGVVRVKSKNGKNGIIKENGKYLEPLSENSIYGSYSLFEINNSENYITQIKNYKGRQVIYG